MSCEFAETTLHGYFDGELDAVRSAEFERHLQSCVDCQSQLSGIESLRKQLQETGLYEHASPQLRAQVRAKISGKGQRAQWKRLLVPAVTAFATAAAVFVITFFALRSHTYPTQTTAELIDAHVRSLQPGHLTDVLSTDQHTVKPWFDGKLDFIPPVNDFSAQGFPLVGGRLDIIDGHNVAAVVYSRRKHWISLFVWPVREQAQTGVYSGSRNGYNWIDWQSNEMQFSLISDVSAADLRQLKDLIQR